MELEAENKGGTKKKRMDGWRGLMRVLFDTPAARQIQIYSLAGGGTKKGIFPLSQSFSTILATVE